MTDRIEDMTITNLPTGTTADMERQLNILRALARNPDFQYRLLFFHLPADIRLHAKYALINLWKETHAIQDLNVADFTHVLIDAIQKNEYTVTKFKQFEEADILLVDDLQFAVGKESLQEFLYFSVLKKRIQQKRLTVVFSEYGYTNLIPALRDDLRNLLKLGLHTT